MCTDIDKKCSNRSPPNFFPQGTFRPLFCKMQKKVQWLNDPFFLGGLCLWSSFAINRNIQSNCHCRLFLEWEHSPTDHGQWLSLGHHIWKHQKNTGVSWRHSREFVDMRRRVYTDFATRGAQMGLSMREFRNASGARAPLWNASSCIKMKILDIVIET